MMLPWIVALSVGLAVFGIGALVFGYQMQISGRLRRQRQFDRLDKQAVAGEYSVAGVGQAGEGGSSSLDRLLLSFTERFQTAQPEKDDEVRMLLARAGYRGSRPFVYFEALRLSLTIALVVVFVGYAIVSGTPGAWAKVFVAGALAYLAPKYVLQHLARRRVQDLGNELPMFIDYLRMIQSAGVSFEQAMVLFTEERRIGLPILAAEFRVVRLAIKSGRSQADALRTMADQIGHSDLREMIALINDAERYGTGLQEPLKQFAIRMAERRRYEMQEYVGKLATKMVVVMVLFLLPALMIITAGPGFLAVYKAFAYHVLAK